MKIAIAAPFGPGIAPLLGLEEGSTPTGYSGAPMLLVLVKALLDRGHDLTLITTDTGLYQRRSASARYSNDRLTVVFCPRRPRGYRFNGHRPGIIMDLFAYERQEITKAISTSSPEVVHAHWTYEFALAALSSKIPTLVTAHDSAKRVLQYSPSPYRLGRMIMQRQVMQRARWLSAVSPTLRDDLAKMTSRPIEVVANPLDDSFFSQTSVNPTRSDRFCMILNDWSRGKNPKSVIRAWPLVLLSAPNAQLHCYGNPFAHGGPAYDWAKKHGFLRNIIFHGPRPYSEIAASLSKFEALINPSLYESFGMVVAEAMAAGTPALVGTESGALRWLVEDGACGGLADMRDPTAIASLILRQLAGAAVSPVMVKRARDRMIAVASVDVVADGYEALYKRVALDC